MLGGVCKGPRFAREKMEPLNVILMLARQRSGTNPLRELLNRHPQIFCTPEVFHNEPSPEADLEVETNFFGFLERHPLGTVSRAMSLEVQETLFVDFLTYLRCFTSKPYLVVDVKYNSAHHLDGPWREVSATPALFHFAVWHRFRVINLTRRNALRSHLSLLKAEMTKRYTIEDGSDGAAADYAVEVDPVEMLHVLRLSRDENRLIEQHFKDYGRYLTFDYEELFPTLGGPPSAAVLKRIARWLELEPEFDQLEGRYRKQSALPLEETILNYDEIVRTLDGTGFEALLEDEAMYRRSAEAKDVRGLPT